MTLKVTTHDVIVYATSDNAARDEAQQYGIMGDLYEAMVTLVTPDSDASVAMSLPAETPWVYVNGDSSGNFIKLGHRFGPAIEAFKAFAVENDATVGAYRKGWQNKHGTAG